MKRIVRFSLLLLVLFSCHRDKTDFLGPGYIAAPSGFAVNSFTATPSPVDFTTTSVSFNASFTSTVNWKITIVGQKSKAVHIIEGISNGLNNVVWTGNHDGVFFFRKSETAVATLSFFGTTLSPTVSIDILKVPDYTTCGQFPLIGDFEDPSKVEPKQGPPQVYSPYWASFNFPTPIPDVVQGVDSMAIDYTGNLVPSVQGTKYYYIKGKGNQSVFVSGIQYFGALTPVLPATPDNVWVNMYIYGTGDKNAGVELEYQEADADGALGGYQGFDDDAFTAKITLDHKGWKLFSFKYSSLTPSLNANFGGSGNKIHEPERLKSFDLVLVKKTTPTSPIEVYFDYPIITVGGPFKPCK